MANKYISPAKLFLAFLLLASSGARAQYNSIVNNKWALGDLYGLNFTNPTNPSPITTAMDSQEGEASICDGNGDFLFYTNGLNVWNKNGAAMPHGDALTGPGINSQVNTLSTTQGALIIPMPDSAHKYYIFSLTQISNCKLFCNVVDMNLDNGLGDVDTTFALRHIALKTGLTEKMTAVAGNSNDVWLMVHGENTDTFFAFHITLSGIDLQPVPSQIGTFPVYAYQQGVIKFSPDRTKLLNCNFRASQSTNAGLEVYDFDVLTGELSNAVVLDNNSYYGGTFSPDNTKVYSESTNIVSFTGTVFQYELTDPMPSLSKLQLGSSGQYTDMKLAPDGKIYFGALPVSAGYSNYRYLARINEPNNVGTACNFQDSVTGLAFPHPTLTTIGTLQQGLPNDVAIPTGSPLNSVLLSFTARAVNTDAQVSWQVASLEKTEGFILERSYDGRRFEVISNIQPQPTNNAFQYTYTDIEALYGHTNIYYRLKFIQKDRTQVYSSTAHLFGYSKDAIISLYPNPVEDVLYLSGTIPVDITVYDMMGKTVTKHKQANKADVSSLPAGTYCIRVGNEKEGSNRPLKFVKL